VLQKASALIFLRKFFGFLISAQLLALAKGKGTRKIDESLGRPQQFASEKSRAAASMVFHIFTGASDFSAERPRPGEEAFRGGKSAGQRSAAFP
jgi:hypothetical protein